MEIRKFADCIFMAIFHGKLQDCQRVHPPLVNHIPKISNYPIVSHKLNYRIVSHKLN